MAFHDLADAGNLAHVERREKFRLLAGNDPEHAVGLGLSRGNFGDEARAADSDGAVQQRFGFHARVQCVRGFQRRTVQARGAGHIEVGFVDRGHFHLRRERAQNFVNFFRALAIALGMSVDENGLRTELGRGAQRHGRVHAELARRIRCGGDYAAFVALSADDHGLAFQRRDRRALPRRRRRRPYRRGRWCGERRAGARQPC